MRVYFPLIAGVVAGFGIALTFLLLPGAFPRQQQREDLSGRTHAGPD